MGDGGRCGGILHDRCGHEFAGDADAQLAALDLDLGEGGIVENVGQLTHQGGVDLGFILELRSGCFGVGHGSLLLPY